MATDPKTDAEYGVAAFVMLDELMHVLREHEVLRHSDGQVAMLRARERLLQRTPHEQAKDMPAFQALEGAVQRWIATRKIS